MNSAFKVLLLLFIVGALSSVAVADEDNLYWTAGAGTTSISTLTNWEDDLGNPPTDLTLDHRCWVNMDSGFTPIITAADSYPGTFWDLNIGVSGGGGAGTVLQTGGATNINWNLNLGVGAIAGDPVSSLTMTGGTLNAGYEIYVGQSGGVASLTLDNATITSSYTQIGREGGDGTLTMTGASTLSASGEFRAGWMGGTGDVSLSDTSQIISTGFQNMGRDGGSVLTVDISGSAKMISTWNETSFGSNGGSAYVTINGSNESDYAGIGNNVDDYWVSFGRDGGSYCSLDMDGYSQVKSGWGGSVDIGVYSATADATMAGHATILPSGDFNVGCYDSASATLSMTGNSFVQAPFMRFAEGGDTSVTLELDNSAELYSPGEIRLGASGVFDATLSGSSKIRCDGNLHVGLWGGNAEVTMNPGTSMYAGSEFHINSFGAGASSVTMDGATLTVGSGEVFVGWTGGADGTLSMNNSTVTTNNNVQFGRENGTGALIMTGASSFSTPGDFRLGWAGGTGNLTMSGTSQITASSFGSVGRNEWDITGSVATITMSGASKLLDTWDAASFGSNGGRCDVSLNGNDPGIDPGDEATWCQIQDVPGLGWWMSFGRDAGSQASLTMRGYSLVRSSIWFDIGTYGATATADLYDDARLYCNDDYGGTSHLSIGRSGSAQVTMHNRSLMNATAGDIQIGVAGSNTTLDMYDTSALIARDKIILGAFDDNGGANDTVVTMHDSATTMTAPSVQVGGTLRGNGSITGAVVAVAGSTIEPGTSIGTLTITGDLDLAGSLDIEYNQANPDKIDLLLVSGDLDLTGGILDFALESGGSALTDLAYVFATYGTLSGSLPTEQNVPAGYHVEYAYGGNNIALVIPEPSTLVLLALGLIGLAAYARRRK
ncbi:MAG: PEP-CTERM sorting domain-containing protein [Pirellulales bacterium]|nr:PEP-CTERM sorting domain-containing protein [Pirellulales bacterium]